MKDLSTKVLRKQIWSVLDAITVLGVAVRKKGPGHEACGASACQLEWNWGQATGQLLRHPCRSLLKYRNCAPPSLREIIPQSSRIHGESLTRRRQITCALEVNEVGGESRKATGAS